MDQCCSGHPSGRQLTAPICFSAGMAALPLCSLLEYLVLPQLLSLPGLCLPVKLEFIKHKPTRHCRGGNNLYSDGPTGALLLLLAFWDVSSTVCPYPSTGIQLDLSMSSMPSLRLALLPDP